MSSRGVSAVWVGYADFLNLLFLCFMVLFLILLSNFAENDGSDTQKQFSQELVNTIGQERLDKWQAEITSDGVIKFKNPDYLFDTGRADLKVGYQENLKEFLPLYIQVMNRPEFKNKIHEIHIDGHTSSIWNTHTSAQDAYFLNLKLSQARTTNTLEYVLRHVVSSADYEWFKKRAVSNGYSSSRPIAAEASSVNQRVEFKAVFENPLDSNQNKSSRKKYTVDIKESS